MPDSAQADKILDTAAATHLLSRAAFGHQPADIERLVGTSRAQSAETLLVDAAWAPQPLPPPWVREPWVNTQRAWDDTTPEELASNHGSTTARYREEMEDLSAWWLNEMVHTTGPLRENLTLFWHGHFTSGYGKVGISQALYQQNVTQRRLALGNFRTLLHAMLTDAAMMLYLDMEESDAEQYNENLARELCELFTLGVGNYGESDVREIARALTGWTLDVPAGVLKPSRPDTEDRHRVFRRDGLTAKFLPERHDGGSKSILGHTGRFGLGDVADILAGQPATATHVTGRLIEYFGAADPEGSLHRRLVETWQSHADSSVQIGEVVRVLLASPEFYRDDSRASQIKGPVRLLVGAARQLELDIEPTPNVAHYVAVLGQTLFNPPNVQGWPGGRTWLNSGAMAIRFHLGDILLDARMPEGLDALAPRRGYARSRDAERAGESMAADDSREARRAARRNELGIKSALEPDRLFPQGVPDDPVAIVDAMAQRLFVRPLSSETRRTVTAGIGALDSNVRLRETVRRLLATAEYQMA